MSKLISIYGPGHQYELWLVIKDGKIFEHTENDGHAFMRRGAEATDTEITMQDVEALAQRYAQSNLVAEVKAALDESN